MSETNHTLANLFIAMGGLLAVQGANPYRVKAYRRAAEIVAALEEDVANIADRDELKKLPGIG
ncbi:MAG: histidinol-phosphatase, partial [Nitrospirales bacterium]